MEEIGSVFCMQDGRPLVAERTQLVVVFTFVDVVANYWFEYTGRHSNGQRDRFVQWVQRYVLTEKNRDYPNGDFSRLSAERLYELRSSLVHFLGLSNQEESTEPIGVVTNTLPEDAVTKVREGFKKEGKMIIVFRPKQLYNLFLEGAILMLGEWRGTIEQAQSDEAKKTGYVEGIKRVYKKILREGAVRVEFPKATKDAS